MAAFQFYVFCGISIIFKRKVAVMFSPALTNSGVFKVLREILRVLVIVMVTDFVNLFSEFFCSFTDKVYGPCGVSVAIRIGTIYRDLLCAGTFNSFWVIIG